MKFLKYFSIAAAALLSFSCQQVDKTFATPADEIAKPVLNAHADIVVDEATLASDVTFTWSAVDYGYPAQVAYNLYAVYGEAEIQLGQSYTTSYTMTKDMLARTVHSSNMNILFIFRLQECSLFFVHWSIIIAFA